MSGPDDLFSHTVPEAHAKFVAACDVAGATTRVIEHPLSGPDGEPLHATVARLGPDDARDVMLVISGTHGIEGYFGSAMQIDAMRRSRDLLPLDDHTAVVMVHLVNPWGTAWSSRENEDNVELLRGHHFCHHPVPPNPIFDDFHETMGYGRITSIDELLATRGRAIELVKRHGLGSLMEAIAAGQGSQPDAITWVGDGTPTWSKRLLDQVAAEHLGTAERLLVWDLHTAVGPPGETVVFHPYPPGSSDDELFRAHLGELWPNPEGLDFYAWFGELCPHLTTRTLICEAGTEQLGPDDQYIFPLDVWIKLHGDRTDPAAAPHLARYRRFFYPETDEWMSSVHAHFVPRWRHALDLLAAPWPA